MQNFIMIILISFVLLACDASGDVITATKEGQNGKLSRLLKKDADPNVEDESGRTALNYALRYGDLDAVKLLLKHNARVDERAYAQVGLMVMDARLLNRKKDNELISLVMSHYRRQNGEEMHIQGTSSVVLLSDFMSGSAVMRVSLTDDSDRSVLIALSQQETTFKNFPGDAKAVDGEISFLTGAEYEASGYLINGTLEVEQIRFLKAPQNAQTIFVPLSVYLPTTQQAAQAGFGQLMPKQE